VGTDQAGAVHIRALGCSTEVRCQLLTRESPPSTVKLFSLGRSLVDGWFVCKERMNNTGSFITDIPSDSEGGLDLYDQRVRECVPHSSLHSLWNLHGVPIREVAAQTWKSLFADRLFGHAAELGFYFLFALFPTLLSASSILGLAARSAHQIYDRLLDYLAVLIPTAALGTVLKTFNETSAASTSGKITFGLIAATWSASVGISAIQDALNVVYKIQNTRSFIKARISAIGLTILLTIIITIGLSSLLAGDVVAGLAYRFIHYHFVAIATAALARFIAWTVATALLALSFAVIYYWAPDFRSRCWHWITPGSAIGILGWLLASLGLRIYIHFFDSYSVTYGSLGAVIILLTWFYITGLMLLLGAEINSEIEVAATGPRLPVYK
jgi:membrane protein